MKGRDKTNAAWFLIFEGDPGCKLARDCCPAQDTSEFMMQVWTITQSKAFLGHWTVKWLLGRDLQNITT